MKTNKQKIMKKRTKKKIHVVTHADRKRIEESYYRKFGEYAGKTLEELCELKASKSVKGTYARALDAVIENKEAVSKREEGEGGNGE